MDKGLLILIVAIAACLILSFRHGAGIFLMVMAAVIPFPLAIGGEGAILNAAPTDVLAAIAVVYLLLQSAANGERPYLGPVGIPLSLFLFVNLYSSLIVSPGIESAMSILRMALGTIVAVLIFGNLDRRLKTAHLCLDLYLLGTNVLSLFSVAAFLSGGFKASEYTLGIHKNGLGPIYGAAIAIAISSILIVPSPGRRWFWWVASMALGGVGITLSLSRGGWISTGAGLALILFLTRRYRAFAATLIVLVPVIAIVWNLLPEKAVDYAVNVSQNSYQIKARLSAMDTVMKAFRSDPVFGVGVGLRKLVEPHNVLVLTLGETGIIGVIAFVGAFGSAFYTFHLAFRGSQGDVGRTRLVVAAFAVFFVALAAGMMDVYWRRGMGFLGWAGVGIAVNILRTPRRPQVGPRRRTRIQPAVTLGTVQT